MPQLVAFGRKWAIGSDDFVYPGIGEVLLRLAWVVAVSVVFHLHKDAFTCDNGQILRTYYIVFLALLVINIIMTAIIVYTSAQGTIINSIARRKLVKLIYVKFLISLPELGWNVIGTYWAFGMSSGCESHIVLTVKCVVLSGWVIAMVVMVGIAVVFDPLGALHKTGRSATSADDDGNNNFAKMVWELRCRVLCCCVATDESSTNAFSGIAELFSNFFEGVDLVATDIACGLILIHRQQEQQKYRLTSLAVETSQTICKSPASSQSSTAEPGSDVHAGLKPWMSVDLMWHYMKYAMGSYGWPLYIFTHLMSGTCRLWSQCTYACVPGCVGYTSQIRTQSCWDQCFDCVYACKKQSITVIETEKEFNELCLSLECCACFMKHGEILNDNCCMCHTAAIKKTTGAHPDDIVYASFHNKIYETPFYVIIDRKQQSVVIAIRGTLSLKDVITDLTAECDTLDIDGLDNCVAHRGMLNAARYVKATLDRLHILDQAFDRAQGAQLVVTGHSLGAGTAALLATLLRPQYPGLICYCYSPPPILSKCGSDYMSEFVCSVVLGKDLVPRLGIHTMEELKARLLRSIHNCDVPKYKLLVKGVWQMMCGLDLKSTNDLERSEVTQPLLEGQHHSISYSGSQPNLENSPAQGLLVAIHEAERLSEQRRITHTPMFLPGRVLQISEKESQSCCGIPEYEATWTSPEDYTQVIVSPKMLSDHLPDAVMRALDQLKEKDHTPLLKRPGAVITV